MADCCAVNTEAAPAPAALECPVSGTRSKRVDILTVKSLLRHLPFGLASTQYYFCESPDCDVVYFPANPKAPSFRRADLLVPVGAKERSDAALVCYCFGVTKGEIRAEIQRAGKSTAPERIKAEVQAGRCACEVKNPSGKCCLGNVTRAIQEAMQEGGQHA